MQDAPFFVEKLQVRMLPCVVMFLNGVAADRIIGFDALGATDDFPTSQVRLRGTGWLAGEVAGLAREVLCDTGWRLLGIHTVLPVGCALPIAPCLLPHPTMPCACTSSPGPGGEEAAQGGGGGAAAAAQGRLGRRGGGAGGAHHAARPGAAAPATHPVGRGLGL